MQALRSRLSRISKLGFGLAAAGAVAVAAAGLLIVAGLWPTPSGSSLPDMTLYPAGAERKAAFFEYLEPIVEEKNTAILQDREILLELADELEAGNSLSAPQLDRLEALVEKYDLDDESTPEGQVQRLLRRVDVVPLPLVLVQAAKESGWGTSRFAREANNLFGHWCFEAGCGIVPERRADGARHEVRDFASVDDAVAAYLQNINTGHAYRRLRDIRAQLRRVGERPSALALADGLLFYSERREEYVNEVKRMILQYHEFQEMHGA